MGVLVRPDSELIRDPGLLVPGRKPTGRVVIDWSNSLTNGLHACVYAENGKDVFLKEGVSSTTTVTTTLVTKNGITRVSDSNTNYIRLTTTLPPGDWTLFMVGCRSGSITNYKGLFGYCESPGSGTRDRTIEYTNTYWAGYVFNGGNRYATTTSPVKDEDPEACVASCGGSQICCYTKGSFIENSTANTGFTGYTTPELIIGPANNYGVNDDVCYQLAGVVFRKWNKAEALSFVNDPYQFLIPA